MPVSIPSVTAPTPCAGPNPPPRLIRPLIIYAPASIFSATRALPAQLPTWPWTNGRPWTSPKKSRCNLYWKRPAPNVPVPSNERFLRHLIPSHFFRKAVPWSFPWTKVGNLFRLSPPIQTLSLLHLNSMYLNCRKNFEKIFLFCYDGRNFPMKIYSFIAFVEVFPSPWGYRKIQGFIQQLNSFVTLYVNSIILATKFVSDPIA